MTKPEATLDHRSRRVFGVNLQRAHHAAQFLKIPLAMCVVVLVAVTGMQGAGASHSKTSKSTATAIDVRIVAQQGLAIALASNVLQSQVAVLTDATEGGSGCIPMTAGIGSSKMLRRVASGGDTTSMITIYYNGGCTHPYIEANARMMSAGGTDAITEDAAYLGTSGAALGTLRVTEDAVISGSKLSVHGTGTFAPHDGAPTVHLGLSCAIPSGSDVPPPFVCEGGIAQTFPKLGVSLGSITPITLTLKAAGTNQYMVNFASSRSIMERDAPGALSIETTANSELQVTGGGMAFTSDATTGTAGWTITDRATKVIFATSVLNNSSRQLRGTVTTSSGKNLAKLNVDRSGTGFLTYSHGATDAITNWLLSG